MKTTATERSNNSRRNTARVMILAASAAAGLSGSARGADNTFTWTGTAGASWGTAANWAGSVAPPLTPAVGDNTILQFGGTLGSGTTAQSAGDWRVYQIQLTNYTLPAGSMTLSTTGSASRDLYLGAGGILDTTTGSTGSVTFQSSTASTSKKIYLTADSTWTVANAGSNNLIIKREIANDPTIGASAHQLIKEGLGTLQFSFSSSWTGGVALNDGGLRLDTVQTGGLGAGTLSV